MARIWSSGFELNSSTTRVENNVTGTGVSTSTAVVRSGTYALSCIPVNSSSSSHGYAFPTSTTRNLYIRVYLNISTLPSTTQKIIGIEVSSFFTINTAASHLKLTPTGTLQLYNGTVKVGSDSAALTAGTWYRVELHIDSTAAAGSQILEARIDGVNFASSTTLTLQATNTQYVMVGSNLGSEATGTTGLWYMDDFAVNDNSGSSQTSWPGSGKIIHLLPNGAGDANTFATAVGGTAGVANNYTRVSEVTPDDLTTYNQATAVNQEDLFNMSDSGISLSDTVSVVAIGLRATDATSNATTAVVSEVRKTSGGTTSTGIAYIPNSQTFTPTFGNVAYNQTLYADPDGNVWTRTTLDSMQAGYKETAFATGHIRVTTLWALVEYVPSGILPSPTLTSIASLTGVTSITC